MYFSFRDYDEIEMQICSEYAIRWTEHEKDIKNRLDEIHKTQIEELKKEIERLKELNKISTILDKISSKIDWSPATLTNGTGTISSFQLPDDVLVYVDDLLGGKVIKQEGTKVIIIDKNGVIKTGLTKQKPDKGYAYKLVRQ